LVLSLVTRFGNDHGMETILVGIDDSPNARRALRWALDHAHEDDQVVAVHVWHMPPVGGFDATFLDPAVFEEGARQVAHDVVADVVTEAEAGRVEIRVVSGHASGALVDQGRTADLLVLGARGRGGFAGLVLGSVTTGVVNHASCPVVVVPPTD
jgi:nucleotide-binding universal stress UspA family protein